MSVRPSDDQIRDVTLAGIPAAFERHGVSVESPLGVLVDAVQDLDASLLPYVTASWLLHHLEQRSPGYLKTVGRSRTHDESASEPLAKLLALFRAHDLDRDSSIARLLRCIGDPRLDPVRRSLQVLDLGLVFDERSAPQPSAALI